MNMPKLCIALIFASACTLGYAQSAFDGTWKTVDPKVESVEAERVSFKVVDGVLSMSTSTGVSYAAKLDATDAPIKGEKSATSVSVTMPSNSLLVEISKFEDKPWLSMRMEIDSSGKRAKVTWTNLRNQKTGDYEVVKE
jgi:hypothetical protein